MTTSIVNKSITGGALIFFIAGCKLDINCLVNFDFPLHVLIEILFTFIETNHQHPY